VTRVSFRYSQQENRNRRVPKCSRCGGRCDILTVYWAPLPGQWCSHECLDKERQATLPLEQPKREEDVKISQAFPSKWLKAADLDGKEWKRTIHSVELVDVGQEGKPENKPCLYFTGKDGDRSEKGIVLNVTNATSISAAFGDETDGWAGKEIVVYPDSVMFQGKPTPCIRVRPVREVAVGSEDDEPPF
jgi:hypothetical protein